MLVRRLASVHCATPEAWLSFHTFCQLALGMLKLALKRLASSMPLTSILLNSLRCCNQVWAIWPLATHETVPISGKTLSTLTRTFWLLKPCAVFCSGASKLTCCLPKSAESQSNAKCKALCGLCQFSIEALTLVNS